MKILQKKTAIVITAIFALILNSPTTFAEEDNYTAFSLGPTSQRVTLTPGESYRSSVKISSPATSPTAIDFILYTTPYGITNENYGATFDQESTYTQIKDWIILDQTEGTVQPNENLEIGFTIKVPDDAPAGGQYAGIVAQDVTGLGTRQNNALNISSISAIGSVIIADVAGNTRMEGEILTNQMPSFLLSNSFTTDTLVRNNGNVHADAKYILQIWPLFSDEEICTNEEQPDTRIILPETERYYSQSCNLPSIGIFRAKQTIKIFGEESIVEKMIIVCPIWLLFIIFAIIAGIIIWVVMRVRTRGKQSRKSANKASE